MRVRLAGVAVLAVLAAGCGGGGGSSSSDADSLVPAKAIAFATVDTDTSSGQVSSALAILKKFPIEPRAEQQLRTSIKQSGVDFDALTSSAGPEVDIAVINVNGQQQTVGLAKPSDEKAFDAQLDKSSSKHTTMNGWTVFADNQATLDAFKNQSGSSIADDATYQAAIKSLPSDAIARFYASPAAEEAVLRAAKSNLPSATLGSLPTAKWFAGALTSKDGAFKLEVHSKSASTKALSKSNPLAGKIPAGSIVALALNGGGAAKALPAATQEQLSVIGQQIGVDLPALISALNGPVIAYVRPGIPLPEVTIAARPAQPQSAATAIGGLLGRFASGAKAVPTQVDGGTLDKLDLGPVSLYYGANDGQLVVTDSSNALAELGGSVGRLTGDAVFKEAKDGAGMTDSAQTFLFVDIKDALPALSGFAQLANQSLPPAAEANLRPLRSALLFGSSDNSVGSFVVYVKTS
ncbi:MAG TPA: hypothetical protein VFU51_02400 [Gaiellaceae bacterium]|jgi:hypothetical protein|nr:hypothetical protein [Gaiellaceae bacterium]